MMSIECQEQLQASRSVSNLPEPQKNLSPQKDHSFNLPPKIKIEPIMAAQYASGIDKESLPQCRPDHQLRLLDSVSQDVNHSRHTPIRGPTSFIK